jgi:dTMP kinase
MAIVSESGYFISFEGIDGSGKSTQMTLCADALRSRGYEVVVTRNPGGTELGADIRRMLLHHPGYVSPTCELLLYMADRAQHMDEVVLPALEAGKIVLCDRHIDSTVAYQGHGRGLSLSLIHTLNETATHGRKPDLTLLFDADPEILASRVESRGEADRLEREALAFRQRVRQGYLALAHRDCDRFIVLDATESIEHLHHQVMDRLLAMMGVPS